MRRKAKKGEKLTSGKNRKSIDRFLERTLQNRISGLEERISQIEEQLDSAGISFRFNEPKRKPGPRQKISDEVLFELRDGLVLWLERVWPEFDTALRKSQTPKDALRLIRKFASPKETRPQYQSRFLRNIPALLDYRAKNKLARIPPKQTVARALTGDWTEGAWKAAARFPTRRMANAMAGVPELDWRTSFDRCAKIPSNMRLGSRTAEHYRKRYKMPAYYVLESVAFGPPCWHPVAGPLYSRGQAKTVVSNRRAPNVTLCIKADDELGKMHLEASKVFSEATGLLAIPERHLT